MGGDFKRRNSGQKNASLELKFLKDNEPRPKKSRKSTAAGHRHILRGERIIQENKVNGKKEESKGKNAY